MCVVIYNSIVEFDLDRTSEHCRDAAKRLCRDRNFNAFEESRRQLRHMLPINLYSFKLQRTCGWLSSNPHRFILRDYFLHVSTRGG